MTKKTAVAAPDPEGDCPHCGRCSKCGRSAAVPVYVPIYIQPYPTFYPQPVYPNFPYGTFTVWNGNNTSTFSNTNANALPLNYNVTLTS